MGKIKAGKIRIAQAPRLDQRGGSSAAGDERQPQKPVYARVGGCMPYHVARVYDALDKAAGIQGFRIIGIEDVHTGKQYIKGMPPAGGAAEDNIGNTEG